MSLFSFGLVLYILVSLHQLYQLASPPPCKQNTPCFTPLIPEDTPTTLKLYTNEQRCDDNFGDEPIAVFDLDSLGTSAVTFDVDVNVSECYRFRIDVNDGLSEIKLRIDVSYSLRAQQ